MKTCTKTLLYALVAIASSIGTAGAYHMQIPTTPFAWGADVGGSVDLSGHDMSTVDIDACFGYRNSWLQLAGMGVSMNMMVNNGNRSFPIYAIGRTSFSRVPRRAFLEARVGCSVNYLDQDRRQTGVFVSGGVGVRLATGPTFSSHILMAYEYYDRSGVTPDPVPDLHMVSVRLGITF